MKIRRAFPGILERQYPVMRGGYPLLTALYLLRMEDVDALPILPVTKKSARAVFGYSSLPKFMSLGPKGFADLLRGPCEAASSELSLLTVEDDLESLFKAFEKRRLGFALVHDGGKTMRVGLLSLADVLALFSTGEIRTGMTVEDAGTPIFSMPGSTTIRDALQTMFKQRHRRIFVSGEESYISDRSIMSYLFSPVFLEDLGRGETRDPLSTPISKVERFTPAIVGPRTSLKAVAGKLRKDRGGCLVASEGRVITPWDVIMRPWLSGNLTFS